MRTALVTGGAGFIGSHLTDRLVREGYHVIIVDNLATGSWSNVAHHSGESVTCMDWDIINPMDLADLPDSIELVAHLASPASPVHYRRLALETLWVNSKGTGNALDIARHFGARFVLGSTSETYGDPELTPQKESYWGNVNPIGPRACYDESKRFGEALTMEYVRQYDLDAVILRFFNCYGPRMQSEDGRVVPNFIMQALRGEALTVYGNGLQTRSFCYVSDEVDAIYRALTFTGLKGQVINVGNPEERTILDFAQQVARISGVQLQVAELPLPVDDPTNRCPDIQRARTLLDWEPEVSLQEGLEATIEYFREFAHP